MISHSLYSGTVTEVGSYVIQWNPKQVQNDNGSKSWDFFMRNVSFASDEVVTKIKLRSSQFSIDELLDALNEAIGKSYSEKTIPILFESYISAYLYPGKAPGLSVDLQKFTRVERGMCKYGSMEDKVLYYPCQSNFPAVELYGKIGNQVYGIQVSTIDRAKECSNTALARFFEMINIPPNEVQTNFTLVYCRLRESSTWKFKADRYYTYFVSILLLIYFT